MPAPVVTWILRKFCAAQVVVMNGEAILESTLAASLNTRMQLCFGWGKGEVRSFVWTDNKWAVYSGVKELKKEAKH